MYILFLLPKIFDFIYPIQNSNGKHTFVLANNFFKWKKKKGLKCHIIQLVKHSLFFLLSKWLKSVVITQEM